MISSPSRPAPLRRNRTRKRQRILDWLRQTTSHPTAAEIHEALLAEFSRLSPGTVYRNLEVLLAQDQIRAVRSAGGALRYDGNLEPHNHFICEACGAIADLDVPAPRSLARRLEREYSLVAERIAIDFYGLCPACSERCAEETSKRIRHD